MIYIDPPYGIKYASNFQPEVGRRDVKDTERDLTREPEMVNRLRGRPSGAALRRRSLGSNRSVTAS